MASFFKSTFIDLCSSFVRHVVWQPSHVIEVLSKVDRVTIVSSYEGVDENTNADDGTLAKVSIVLIVVIVAYWKRIAVRRQGCE